MAVSDDIKKQRQKLKGKGLKAQLAWFWEYEKWPTIGVIVAVCVVGSLIYHFVTYKPAAYSIVFLNAYMQDYQDDNLEDGFMEYAGIDASTSGVTADLSESLTPGDLSSSQYDMYTVQKLMAWTAAGQIDAAVMDSWYFEYYSLEGYFADLREVLDEETLEQHKDQLYYVDGALLDMTEEELLEVDAAASEDSESDSEEVADTQEEDTTATLGYTMSAAEKAARESEAIENFTLPDPDTMENPIPVGIQCNTAPYILENENYSATACIVGCVSSGEHAETFQQFLEYLYEK